MKTYDTSNLFLAFQEGTAAYADKKYFIDMSGISSYRINIARRTDMDFNNLKVKEIIKLQDLTNDLWSSKVCQLEAMANKLGCKLPPEWEKIDIDLDTSQIYYDLLACLQDKDAKRIITSLCSVSPYRLEKAIKSEDDFNNLKLNEVIKIGELIEDIYNNVYDI